MDTRIEWYNKVEKDDRPFGGALEGGASLPIDASAAN